MRYRKISATLAVVICVGMLCACTDADGRFSAVAPGEAKTLRLVVESGLGSSARVQTGLFADRVKTLTGGTLTITVVAGTPTARTAAGGGTDLALFGNAELAEADSSCATFSMPFFYDNPEHMSAALNSGQMLGLLAERLEPKGITPLAAFYNGSRFFMSSGEELGAAADFVGRTVAVRGETPDTAEVLTALGANVVELPAGTGAPTLGAELTLPDGGTVTVDAVETTALRAGALLPDGDNDEQVYFSESYHRISPIWLVGNTKTLSSLSPVELAAISEAVAGLLPQLETWATDKELRELQGLQERGAVIVGIDRQQIAASVYDASQGGYVPPPYFDFVFYDLVGSFSP